MWYAVAGVQQAIAETISFRFGLHNSFQCGAGV